MTRCHCTSASSQAQGGAQSLPTRPSAPGPLAAESHPVLSGPGALAHGLQCQAAWGPFRDASPDPRSPEAAAMCPGRSGRLPAADLWAPRFSGRSSRCPSPTGLSIPVSGSPGPRPPMVPLRPANPTRASAAVPPRAWLPGVGSEPGLASGKRGCVCMCVRGRRGCRSRGR